METKDLEGVGVGSPGVVDDAAGTVAGAGNLPHWDAPFALRDTLTEALGCPVRLGNDVQVATDAEVALGAGRPYRSLLGVFWGTGVGGGIVLDGKPWLGRSAAGEIGHVVVKIGGRRCPCGRKGCMEAYAGRGAMERRARKRMDKGEKTELFKIMEKRGRERLSSGVWARALKAGDDMAASLVDEAVEALGAGRGVGGERAGRGGRGHRRRHGPADGQALRRPDPGRHDPAPVQRLRPARRGAGRARRPRRRDRRLAARAVVIDLPPPPRRP